MPEPATTTVSAEVPPRIVEALRALVAAGLYPDLDCVIRDALQRFTDSHQDALLEKQVREDVEWGLRSADRVGPLTKASSVTPAL